MPLTFYAIDDECAAATGSNVNVSWGKSRFDNPPDGFRDLVIEAKGGKAGSRRFEIGGCFGLRWNGGCIAQAGVVRSDMVPGRGAVIVFEGPDGTGNLAHVLWTPGFNLGRWYRQHYDPRAEPQFHVTASAPGQARQFICFNEDVRIATAMGGVRAGDIWQGDLVQTRDGGPRPVVRAERRVVRGQGANAPVLFAPGSIGNHSPLKLSQQQRVLIRAPLAEAMFGAPELLVPARAMINGEDICLQPRAHVAYVHLALAQPHLLIAEGAYCESAVPDEMALHPGDLSPPFAHQPACAAQPFERPGAPVAMCAATLPEPSGRAAL